jgi:hypothetical protein
MKRRILKSIIRRAREESKKGWARALRFWDTIFIIVIFCALIISCSMEVLW